MSFPILIKVFKEKIRSPIFLLFLLIALVHSIFIILKIKQFDWISTLDFYESLIFIGVVALSTGVFGKEISSGTIQLLIIRPVKRSSIYISKLGGVTLSIFCFNLILHIFALILAIYFHYFNNLELIVYSFFSSILFSIYIISLVALFSVFLPSYSDILGFLICIILIASLYELLRYFLKNSDIVLFIRNILFGPEIDVQQWLKGKKLIELLAYIIKITIFNFIGIFIFSKREFKS